jgi:hypothetical protein
MAHAIYADSFNTGTLVAHSVIADSVTNFNTSTLMAHAIYADTFNTGTLVTTAVNVINSPSFNTSTLVAHSVYADTFNTSTLVTTAVNVINGTTFNTSTLVTRAVTATYAATALGLASGVAVTGITAGTGTAVSGSTGNITIWTTATSGSVVLRTTFSTSTAALTSGTSAATVIVGAYKAYALLSIQTSIAAWVTVYSTAAAQTADSSRGITADPIPGSGVIAEAITTQSGTVTFTPAVIGFNNEASPTTSIPLKIYNNTTGSSAVTVTLTLLKLEG